ncbi:MAG: hypothetical protein WDN26_01700 [Chitinophagaceae bacterium]
MAPAPVAAATTLLRIKGFYTSLVVAATSINLITPDHPPLPAIPLPGFYRRLFFQ